MASSDLPPAGHEFEDVIAVMRGSLVQRAQWILRDQVEAEDIVQDTVIALWQQWAANPPRNPHAYAHRAVALNAIKRLTRVKKLIPLDQNARIEARQPEEEPLIDPLALERALEILPPAQQAVIRLRFYVGLTMTEIGTTLAISTDTAASRCRYALAKMRSTLTRITTPTTIQAKEPHERYTHIKTPHP